MLSAEESKRLVAACAECEVSTFIVVDTASWFEAVGSLTGTRPEVPVHGWNMYMVSGIATVIAGGRP